MSTNKIIISLGLVLSLSRTAAGEEKPAVVGTWQIRSFSMLNLETKVSSLPFGENPSGYIQYSPGGHMVVFLQSGDPKKPTNFPYTETDRAEAHRTIFGAYAGTYTVEGNKVVHHIIASWRPEWIGTDQTRYFDLDGNKLALKTAPQSSTVAVGQTVSTLVFERVE